MILSPEDRQLFYKLYHPLLLYAARNFNLLEGVNSFDELFQTPYEEINKLRMELFKDSPIIDSFCTENPFNFPQYELEIVETWKDFVRGRFIILRHLKKYTLFLDIDEPPHVYGVTGITTPIEEVLVNELPLLATAVLLPFKDRIIYDGLLESQPVSFGKNMRNRFNQSYQEAKFRYGIITSLPQSGEAEKSDTDRLRFYLKNETNRITYQSQIEAMINQDREFLKIYQREMGKISARGYSRKLRKVGVEQGWFAILEGVIISSGTTHEEVKDTLEYILTEDKVDLVYLFQMKPG